MKPVGMVQLNAGPTASGIAGELDFGTLSGRGAVVVVDGLLRGRVVDVVDVGVLVVVVAAVVVGAAVAAEPDAAVVVVVVGDAVGAAAEMDTRLGMANAPTAARAPAAARSPRRLRRLRRIRCFGGAPRITRRPLDVTVPLLAHFAGLPPWSTA
jgi:hypothetical protein